MNTLPLYQEQDKKILSLLARLINTRWRVTLLAAILVIGVYCVLPVSITMTSGLSLPVWTSSNSNWQNADVLQHIDTLIGTFGPGTLNEIFIII